MTPPSLSHILRATADRYGVSVAMIRSHAKFRQFVRPRHMVVYLGRTLTRASYPQITRAVGRKNHTSSLHAMEATTRLLTTDEITRRCMTDIVASLSHGDYNSSARPMAERSVCEALGAWRP